MKPSPSQASRTHVNVVDLSLQARASAAVHAALGRTLSTLFHTQDAAVKAWASIVQPITNRFHVEVASRLYSMTGTTSGPTRIGTPAIGKEDCQRSYQCGVDLSEAGSVPRGLLSGYVHSHPDNLGFSDNDLDKLVRIRVQAWSTPEVTAFVSSPDGRILAWSTRMLTERPQASWRDYAKRTVREVR